jgi:Uncharacterized conserved protein (DUF2190)
MSQQVESGFKQFPASAAISQYARVKMASDGTISAAGLTDKEIGIAQNAAFNAGDIVNVRLRTAAGTLKMIASAAITRGNEVFTAASGKIGNSASTGWLIGRALEAAGANNDIIEVLYNTHGDTVVP